MKSLQVGQQAPSFTLMSDEKKWVSLEDFQGQHVILYFYPKDNTPGCTKESCDFRDQNELFQQKNAVILGISKDSVETHAKFKSRFKLPFTLLADTEGKVCELYHVWVEKNFLGKKYKGIERTTFLIDEQGIIQAIWPRVKVLGHVMSVLKALEKA